MTWHDMVLTWHDRTLHCLTFCQVTLHSTLKGILINFPMAPLLRPAKKCYIPLVTSTTINYIHTSIHCAAILILSIQISGTFTNFPGKRWVMAASSHWNSPFGAKSAGIKAVNSPPKTGMLPLLRCLWKRASEKDMTTNGMFLWTDVFRLSHCGFHSVWILAIPSNERKVAGLLAASTAW